MEKLGFTWVDYLLFSIIMVICTLIGVIQGIRDRWGTRQKKQPGEEKELSLLPVIWSIVASSFSSNFVLGFPAEMYYLGTEFGVVCIGFAIGIPTAIFMFIKKFYEIGVPSVFDYIGMRYGTTLKSFLTVLYALAMILYMGLIIYAPALAFGNATNLPIYVSILIVGMICIIYTTLGGLKGVLWIDTLQMLIVLGVGLANCIYGVQLVGGIVEVWEIATNGTRIEWPTWSANPTIRHSFWSCTVGGVATLWLLVTNQAITQKFLGLPNMKQVFIAGFSYLFVVELFCCIYMLSGIVMYTYYVKVGCEPTATGQIEKVDQLVPFFVLDAFKGAHGLSGIFTAAVFGASLSTVSAGINALAGLTIRDLINPLYFKRTGHRITKPVTSVLLFKGLSVFWGLVALAIGFVAPLMGRSVLQIGLTLLSIASGPLVGVLIIGIYVPFTEKIGAFIGVMTALAFELALLIGAQIYPSGLVIKALPPTDNCPVDNITEVMTSPFITTTTLPTTTIAQETPSASTEIFKISYLLYAPFGILITMVVAMLSSAIVRCTRGQCFMDLSDVDKKLLCSACLPKDMRTTSDDIDEKEEKPIHKNGKINSTDDTKVSVDDISPDIRQTSEFPIATSLAFAHDNKAYLDDAAVQQETARL